MFAANLRNFCVEEKGWASKKGEFPTQIVDTKDMHCRLGEGAKLHLNVPSHYMHILFEKGTKVVRQVLACA